MVVRASVPTGVYKTASCSLALPWFASVFTVYEDITPIGSSVPATPVVFEGVVTAVGVPCDLELDAELLVYGSTVEINVLAGSVPGSAFCNSVSLSSFPWYSATPTSAFPTWFYDPADVSITFHNVQISMCGSPASVALDYNNWNIPQTVPVYRLSTIEFSNVILGTCSLNGVLQMQGTDYNLVNN